MLSFSQYVQDCTKVLKASIEWSSVSKTDTKCVILRLEGGVIVFMYNHVLACLTPIPDTSEHFIHITPRGHQQVWKKSQNLNKAAFTVVASHPHISIIVLCVFEDILHRSPI